MAPQNRGVVVLWISDIHICYELINNAVTVYLNNLSPYLDLKNELADWDRLADEALAKVDQAS